MEITIVQAILIALWTSFCLAGMLLGIYTNRCIIMAAGVGVILGDPVTGLMMGAVGELAFMGYGVNQGGSIPPNPMGPGIVGALMAIVNKVPVETALALSIPFAVFFQFVLTATYTFCTTLSGTALKALDRKDFRTFRLTANVTIWIFAIVGFLVGLAAALSTSGLGALIDMIPAWLNNGLTVAGKMLPAIGFAMILNVMGKTEHIPFVLLGYVAACYLGLNTMGLTILATAVALIVFFNTGKGNAAAEEEEVVFEDGI